MESTFIVHIIIILLLLYIIKQLSEKKEGLCVNAPYGVIDSEPYSTYVNANMALTNTTSLGQAPNGAPIGFIPGGSPITQGQYGIYQTPLTLDQVDNFNRASLMPAAMAMPVYTEPPFDPQEPQVTNLMM